MQKEKEKTRCLKKKLRNKNCRWMKSLESIHKTDVFQGKYVTKLT